MIKFRCTECHHKMGVDDRHAGRKVKCSKCGQVNQIPELPVQEDAVVHQAVGRRVGDSGSQPRRLVNDGATMKFPKPTGEIYDVEEDMKECPHCRKENRESVKTCEHCGQPTFMVPPVAPVEESKAEASGGLWKKIFGRKS
jgi:phage FluMu protein Com